MLTEQEILDTLDNYRNGYDPAFAELGHPYVYPIDSRINIFRNNQDKWALAVEVLGFNPRADAILLQITYYGNCLFNLENTEGYDSNSYYTTPIDLKVFNQTIEYENLKPDADFWMVRSVELKLSRSKDEYRIAGIRLKEYEPNAIRAEEVARLLVTKNRDLFRATNEELYKSIPSDMERLLVIDEWYHKDFYQLQSPFERQDILSSFDLNNESVKEMIRQELTRTRQSNLIEWENNRPSSYETWQQIAKVIVTGDMANYRPTLAPNSHWSNWPDAGSM
jgi:hypothetical protein